MWYEHAMDPANLRAVPLFSTMEEQHLKKIATFAAEDSVAGVGRGDVFGETGVLERGLRNASIVASSPMRLIRLSTWEVKRLPQETRDRLAKLVENRRARR